MVGAVGTQGMVPGGEAGPGKRAMAVGQQAKIAVAAAREAGVDLPKNAQGMAASALAKGADAASIFAGLTAPDVVDDGGMDTEVTDGGAATETPAIVADAPVTGDDVMPPVVGSDAPVDTVGLDADDDGAAAPVETSGDTTIGTESVGALDAAELALQLLSETTETQVG